jgi:hypothetical protein
MKILFNPPLAILVVGVFYVLGFLAHSVNQIKARLPKRALMKFR